MRAPDYTRRVVVTGLGVISPVGNDRQTAWSNLVERSVGHPRDHQVRRLRLRPARRPARSTTSPPPSGWTPRPSGAARPALHYGVAAAKQALADSGFEIDDANRTEVGVVFGSGAGGQSLMIDNYVIAAASAARGRSPRRSSPTPWSTRARG